MARRPFAAEPMSRLAILSARLAWFSLAVAALSVVILRSGFLEVVPALITFAAALVFAALAILIAFAGAVVIWRQGMSGIGRLVLAVLIGSALLAYPGYLAYRASQLPAIADITTSPANPPRFEVIARLRPRGTSDYPGPAAATLQRAAYPDITPLQVLAPPRPAYDAALAVVTKRKWSVVDARPPSPTRRDGVIEAVARTTIMGFRDDVVIRVAPLGTGSQIDVRSASRIGTHDLGTNAARIRSLLEDIDEAAPLPDTPKAEPDKRPATPRRPANQPANQPRR